MIDNTTTGQRVEAEIRARFGDQVFATAIRRSEHFKQGISKGGSVLTYAPTSAAAASFRDLAAEIAGNAGQKSSRAKTGPNALPSPVLGEGPGMRGRTGIADVGAIPMGRPKAAKSTGGRQ